MILSKMCCVVGYVGVKKNVGILLKIFYCDLNYFCDII